MFPWQCSFQVLAGKRLEKHFYTESEKREMIGSTLLLQIRKGLGVEPEPP